MTNPPVPGTQFADMLRRLRARPVSSWRHGDRTAAARRALQRLADLAADAGGEPRRIVPDLGVAALADQLAVLVDDARSAGVDQKTVTAMLDGLADILAVHRGPVP